MYISPENKTWNERSIVQIKMTDEQTTMDPKTEGELLCIEIE